MRALFTCDHCGTAVGPGEPRCPGCGRFFDAVKCPRCGHSGSEAAFRRGCPSCGYLSARPRPGTGGPRRSVFLPAISVVLVLTVLAALAGWWLRRG